MADTYIGCAGAYIDASMTKFAAAVYNTWTPPSFALIITLDITDSGVMTKTLPNFYSATTGDVLEICNL